MIYCTKSLWPVAHTVHGPTTPGKKRKPSDRQAASRAFTLDLNVHLVQHSTSTAHCAANTQGEIWTTFPFPGRRPSRRSLDLHSSQQNLHLNPSTSHIHSPYRASQSDPSSIPPRPPCNRVLAKFPFLFLETRSFGVSRIKIFEVARSLIEGLWLCSKQFHHSLHILLPSPNISSLGNAHFRQSYSSSSVP